jgi:hypothetical protein
MWATPATFNQQRLVDCGQAAPVGDARGCCAYRGKYVSPDEVVASVFVCTLIGAAVVALFKWPRIVLTILAVPVIGFVVLMLLWSLFRGRVVTTTVGKW